MGLKGEERIRRWSCESEGGYRWRREVDRRGDKSTEDG